MTRPAGPWAALQADFLATSPAGPMLKQVSHVIVTAGAPPRGG